MSAPRWHGFLDRQAAARPDAPAITDTVGARWSYAGLGAAADDLAGRLRRAGVRRGDRVLILSENCAAAVAALFACSRMGAWAVPVNARLTAPELSRILAHAEPAAALFTTAVSPDARAHAARMEARPLSGAFGRMHMATPCPGAAPERDEEVAVLLYTTGTTGTPKGVMLTHANLCHAAPVSAQVRGLVAADDICGILPLTHVFGLASVLTAGICAGARIRLEARFDEARLLGLLRAGVTVLSAVPQIHARLMAHARRQGIARLEGGRLRYVSSGAAPLDPDWKRRAEAFYGVAMQNGYGLTETTAGICVTRNRRGDPDISVGPPLPGAELRIDESVPGGGDGIGEVLTRGPHVMKGYFRNPEGTARVLDRAGWLRTGDLGRIDRRGHLHILGRLRELIIHGGFNVYPPEVEAALNEHPKVVQCAVVGRRRDGDEEVLAFVQALPGNLPDEAELHAFAAARLAGYKRPARIVIATELPAAPTGKILKHRLEDAFAERLGRDRRQAGGGAAPSCP